MPIAQFENGSLIQVHVDFVTRFQQQSRMKGHIVACYVSFRDNNLLSIHPQIDQSADKSRVGPGDEMKVINTVERDSEDTQGQVHRTANVQLF